MKVHLATARVAAAARKRYLCAWGEWSGTLFGMGIRSDLLESEDEPGVFTEVTWLAPGEEGALADDRIVRIHDALCAASERRRGDRTLHAVIEQEAGSPSGGTSTLGRE